MARGLRLTERLGGGGLSAVYRAEGSRGRVAAVKVLHPLYADLPPLRRRIAREAELARRVGAAAPEVIATGEVMGIPYVATRLVDGELLAARLASAGRLPPREAIAVGRALLRALRRVHACGIIHRDVKPANVILVRGGVKLLDFGSAVVDGEWDNRALDEVAGTPAYMAPEQADGRAVDPRCDLYATGVVLFQALTGRRPFGGDPVEQMRAHLESPPPHPRAVEPSLSEALGDAVLRALEKDPERRFPDADAMAASLGATPEWRGRR